MQRYRKTALSVTTLIVIVALVLAWHRFWPGPRRVNGGLFELHKVLTAQAGVIWRARFSPDGTLIVSASTDGTAKVWTTDGTIVQDLKHPSGVTAADFSPDGRTVATTSYDGVLRIWNLEDGSLTSTITAGSNTLWCLAFSPDGKTIASAGEDRVVSLWNVADGTLIRTLAGHRLNVWAVAFQSGWEDTRQWQLRPNRNTLECRGWNAVARVCRTQVRYRGRQFQPGWYGGRER